MLGLLLAWLGLIPDPHHARVYYHEEGWENLSYLLMLSNLGDNINKS